MNNPPIPQYILDRLIVIEEFNNDEGEIYNARAPLALSNSYAPLVRIDFNINWNLPENHLDIGAYRNRVTVPATQIPYFTSPRIGDQFPNGNRHRIYQPMNTSILPLLVTGQNANVDFRQYDIVSERNSLRKIAMNNEEYMIGVVQLGGTLLLRRHDNRTVNMGDVGHRFEQMCTPGYASGVNYGHLIEGHIGELRTLITAEVDAVVEERERSIELKCQQRVNDRYFHSTWLQAFLSGTETIIIGYRSNDEPLQLVGTTDYRVSEMIDKQYQTGILQHLYRVLRFLQVNVIEGHSYLLRRHFNPEVQATGLYLYEVTNQDDKTYLTFINQQMIDEFFTNN